ncbi:MAG: hypothetical protein GWO20_12320 [Candidatus Korarchaeota archaeon]|nr:hypothetical protein [Candidatus Korarchaeota archaeon]NIU84213.1 hypothetical protein [Candidatus Thorarchaeota archaeon]NIW14365.1 hypothetical protein [Candidatus Thorarchaeota archaeon]NIW52451.1 hypothetical protein [Candidatus Korarchaeota archaeon]
MKQKSIIEAAVLFTLLGMVVGYPLTAFTGYTPESFETPGSINQSFIPEEGNELGTPNFTARYRNGIAILNTSTITIKVTGGASFIPHFLFWPTGNNTTVYHAKFVHLAEYYDQNKDGAFQYNEIVKFQPGGRKIFPFTSGINWEFSGFYEMTESGKTVAYGFNFTMQATNPNPKWENVNITIVNRFYVHNTEEILEAGGESATFNVSGLSTLKTNVFVTNWPFTNFDIHKLALRWDISQTGTHTQNRIRGDPVNVGKNMTKAKRVDPPHRKREISIECNAGKNYTTRIRVPNVVMLRSRDRTQERLAQCNMSYRTDTENIRMFMSADAINGTVVYDPIFEVAEGSISGDEQPSDSEPTNIGLISVGIVLTAIIFVVIIYVVKKRK